jgi:hypothetical protein
MNQDIAQRWRRLPSRRDVLRGLAAAGIGLLAVPRLDGAAARKERTRKVKLNAFGCVDAGGVCKTNGQCCSGICQGKRGKKTCRVHDATTCEAGQTITDVCGGKDVSCTTSTGNADGACLTTTGNAPYCARESFCHACKRDADCRPFCGEDAACVTCVGCTDAGGTACASPTLSQCQIPG